MLIFKLSSKVQSFFEKCTNIFVLDTPASKQTLRMRICANRTQLQRHSVKIHGQWEAMNPSLSGLPPKVPPTHPCSLHLKGLQ